MVWTLYLMQAVSAYAPRQIDRLRFYLSVQGAFPGFYNITLGLIWAGGGGVPWDQKFVLSHTWMAPN